MSESLEILLDIGASRSALLCAVRPCSAPLDGFTFEQRRVYLNNIGDEKIENITGLDLIHLAKWSICETCRSQLDQRLAYLLAARWIFLVRNYEGEEGGDVSAYDLRNAERDAKRERGRRRTMVRMLRGILQRVRARR